MDIADLVVDEVQSSKQDPRQLLRSQGSVCVPHLLKKHCM